MPGTGEVPLYIMIDTVLHGVLLNLVKNLVAESITSLLLTPTGVEEVITIFRNNGHMWLRKKFPHEDDTVKRRPLAFPPKGTDALTLLEHWAVIIPLVNEALRKDRERYERSLVARRRQTQPTLIRQRKTLDDVAITLREESDGSDGSDGPDVLDEEEAEEDAEKDSGAKRAVITDGATDDGMRMKAFGALSKLLTVTVC